MPLLAEAERLKGQGDQLGYQVFAFLAEICSLRTLAAVHRRLERALSLAAKPGRPKPLHQETRGGEYAAGLTRRTDPDNFKKSVGFRARAFAGVIFRHVFDL